MAEKNSGGLAVAEVDAPPKCRICQCRLDETEDDDMENHVCSSCKSRPEGKRLLGLATITSIPPANAGKLAHSKSARDFTPAEKGLIRKVHGFMPHHQLLSILNERLASDLGPDALPYTMDQLHAELNGLPGGAPAGGHDYPSLRKLLANAERAGTLDKINEQVINDFAVVFSLNPKQVLVLKDIILQAKEAADEH